MIYPDNVWISGVTLETFMKSLRSVSRNPLKIHEPYVAFPSESPYTWIVTIFQLHCSQCIAPVPGSAGKTGGTDEPV